MDSRKCKITKRVVDAAEKPASGEGKIWDTELAGFCLQIYASGRKAYAVKYRADGRQRWYTIGEHGSPWTPEAARKVAEEVLYGASRGQDAQALKDERRSDCTVSEFIDEYLTEGPLQKPDKRQSSWNADRGSLNNHVRPLLGSKLVRDVRRADIGRMLKGIAKGETKKRSKTKPRGVANVRGGAGISVRTLAVTKAMFSYAERTGQLKRNPEGNPTKGIKLPKSASRERFLSAEEAIELEKTIASMVDGGALRDDHAAIFRLLMLTGARRSEIVGLQWDEVDFHRRRLDFAARTDQSWRQAWPAQDPPEPGGNRHPSGQGARNRQPAGVPRFARHRPYRRRQQSLERSEGSRQAAGPAPRRPSP